MIAEAEAEEGDEADDADGRGHGQQDEDRDRLDGEDGGGDEAAGHPLAEQHEDQPPRQRHDPDQPGGGRGEGAAEAVVDQVGDEVDGGGDVDEEGEAEADRQPAKGGLRIAVAAGTLASSGAAVSGVGLVGNAVG